MAGFGENLKREREMRGVSLEEMSESTKISTRLLRAIEQDHFSELPGGVFTRGFIRAYSKYLGLDEEHVLAEYKRVAQPNNDYDLSRMGTSKTGLGSRQARVLPWVVAAALLGGGYAAYRYGHRPTPVPPPPVTVSSEANPPATPQPSAANGTSAVQSPALPPPNNGTSAAPGQAAGQPSNSSPAGSAKDGTNPPSPSVPAGGAGGTAAQPGGSQPSTSTAAPPGAVPGTTAPALGEGDMVLQVATTEDVWMAVSADGKVLMQRLLPANSVRTFRAKDYFDVTTGNAFGTILTLDGETEKPLGREGEFKKVHLAHNEAQQPHNP